MLKRTFLAATAINAAWRRLAAGWPAASRTGVRDAARLVARYNMPCVSMNETTRCTPSPVLRLVN